MACFFQKQSSIIIMFDPVGIVVPFGVSRVREVHPMAFNRMLLRMDITEHAMPCNSVLLLCTHALLSAVSLIFFGSTSPQGQRPNWRRGLPDVPPSARQVMTVCFTAPDTT